MNLNYTEWYGVGENIFKRQRQFSSLELSKTQKQNKKQQIKKHGIYKNPEGIAVRKAVNTYLGVKILLDFVTFFNVYSMLTFSEVAS